MTDASPSVKRHALSQERLVQFRRGSRHRGADRNQPKSDGGRDRD